MKSRRTEIKGRRKKEKLVSMRLKVYVAFEEGLAVVTARIREHSLLSMSYGLQIILCLPKRSARCGFLIRDNTRVWVSVHVISSVIKKPRFSKMIGRGSFFSLKFYHSHCTLFPNPVSSPCSILTSLFLHFRSIFYSVAWLCALLTFEW